MLKLRTDVVKDYEIDGVVPVILTYLDKNDGYAKHIELNLDKKTAEWFLDEFKDATGSTRVKRYVHDINFTRGEDVSGVYKNVQLKEERYSKRDNERALIGAFEIKDTFYMPDMRFSEKYKEIKNFL